MNSIRRNKLAILIFTLPALIVYSLIVIYPVFQTVTKSFYEWDGLSKAVFTGIQNYREIFQDPDFYISFKNGFIFAAVLIIYQIGMASIFSIILSSKRTRGSKIFRNAFFIPVVLSITVVCQLWISIYHGQYGLLNQLFNLIGIQYQQDWLSDPKIAIFAVAFVNAWQFMGYQLVLIYTGIKAIPEYYYEAACLDGASSWKAHMKITVPLLAETYKFCLVIALTGGLRAFEHMYIITGGGPGTSTYSLTYLMYKAAFQLNEYGYACTSATILVVMCLIFTVLINKYIARERITY